MILKNHINHPKFWNIISHLSLSLNGLHCVGIYCDMNSIDPFNNLGHEVGKRGTSPTFTFLNGSTKELEEYINHGTKC